MHRGTRTWPICTLLAAVLAAPEARAMTLPSAVLQIIEAAEGVACAYEMARRDLNYAVGVAGEAGAIACVVRVSVTSGGLQHSGGADSPSISPTGRFVLFASNAADLVPDDTNGRYDAFVHDRLTGSTSRVSLANDGAQVNAAAIATSSISENGRHVIFRVSGSGFPGAGQRDILLDRDADADGIFDEPGAIVGDAAALAADGDPAVVRGARLSPDGRFVVFESAASDLAPGDTNGRFDVYVRDRDVDEDGVFDEPGQTANVRASVDSAGAQGTGLNAATEGRISADGRFAVFVSTFPNLAPSDTNGTTDVFVRDRDVDQNGVFDEPGEVKTVRVSVAADGSQAEGGQTTRSPGISDDGRWVVFTSSATNLVPETVGSVQVYLHDRDADGDGEYDEPGAISTQLVTKSAAGVPGNGFGDDSAISADGRFIAFRASSRNLVTGVDTGGIAHVFLYDRALNLMSWVSGPRRGPGSGAAADDPAMGVADGLPLVAFTSGASNLVPFDTNGRQDIFVYDADIGTIP